MQASSAQPTGVDTTAVSAAEEEKKEEVELLLQPLKIKPSEFIDFATDYYAKLLPEMRDTFQPPE